MLGTYLQIHEIEPNTNSIRPSFQIITYSFDALGNLISIFNFLYTYLFILT